jgi:putative endonuclease
MERRLAEHRGKGGRGARYLRGRGPLKVVYKKRAGTRSQALKMECRLKRMKKKEKEEMAIRGLLQSKAHQPYNFVNNWGLRGIRP